MTDLTSFCNSAQLLTAACTETQACVVGTNAVGSCSDAAALIACQADECCKENGGWVADCLIRSTYSHWVVIGLSIFAIVWGIFQAMQVS